MALGVHALFCRHRRPFFQVRQHPAAGSSSVAVPAGSAPSPAPETWSEIPGSGVAARLVAALEPSKVGLITRATALHYADHGDRRSSGLMRQKTRVMYLAR